MSRKKIFSFTSNNLIKYLPLLDTRGPESVYWTCRWYRTNQFLSGILRFKAMQNNYILSSQVDNLTNLSYKLVILSVVPDSVNMLSYFIGQFIFVRQIEKGYAIISWLVQFVQFIWVLNVTILNSTVGQNWLYASELWETDESIPMSKLLWTFTTHIYKYSWS